MESEVQLANAEQWNEMAAKVRQLELEVKDLLGENVEFSRCPIRETPLGRKLVEIFWAIAEKSGSDIRLDVGVPFRPKALPRASIDPALWR